MGMQPSITGGAVSRFTRPAVAGVLGALVLAPAAFGGQVPRSDLNPPPPSDYVCQATADQTICRVTRFNHHDPAPTDIFCGSGADEFEVSDQGDDTDKLMRRYDADGNFVERVDHEVWLNAMWSNPLTGDTIPYTQRQTTTDRLGVPGDESTITETQTGENVYTDPVTHKKVLRSVGRTVFSPEGDLEFGAGQQPFIDRFLYGDPSSFDALCAALAR
jgi:hypothetical protein